MAALGWARCLDNVADVLRRGAWYRIVDETPDGKLVVECRHRPVRLNRLDVTIRTTPPDHWSIVVRTGVLRPTLGGGKGVGGVGEVTSTYAVCPYCHERQEFGGRPAVLGCTRCRRDAPIDWSETC